MLFLLLAFKNDHSDVRVLFRLGQLLLGLAHELHVDVDVLVWLQLALHGRDREHLFRLGLLHSEVEANRVLALVLEVERQLFGFSHSDCSEVQLRGHSIVERNIEGLRVDLDLLFLLLDSVALHVLDLEFDRLEELLLSQ